MKRDELLNWLWEHDKYSFLWDENWSDKKLLEIKKIILKMEHILNIATKNIIKLGKSKLGQEIGMRDTATDEAIVEELYSLIH